MTTNHGRSKRRLFLAIFALQTAALFSGMSDFPGAAGGGQSARPKAAKPNSAATRTKEPAMPFGAGETLNYRVSWAAFSNAASVQLTVPERRDLFGWDAWHFRAVAHTLSPVHTLFAVDDQFDSYTDAVTLQSRQYEMHLSELGRKQEDRVLHLVSPGQKPRAPGPSVVVFSGTRDPLGTLYTLRGVDWQRTPEVRAPVYDGHDVYEMSANMESASEDVTVAAGRFSTSRISIRVFQSGKEVASTHFTVWLANDARRIPVAMEAALPFGKLRAELIAATR